MEITPIGIQNIGWRFWIVWTVTNLLFLPILYFFYPETGQTLSLKLHERRTLTFSQQIVAWRILMRTIGPNHRLLLLGTGMLSAEAGHKSISIMSRMRFRRRHWVRRILNLGYLSMWNGLVAANSHHIFTLIYPSSVFCYWFSVQTD